MKRTFTSLLLLLMVAAIGLADEGMWLLPLIQKLNIGRMNEMGFKLTADDIYSMNRSSLKDAVVALDYGSCTAEMVSADGLLFTNHHCGYDEIQAHSTVDHDYLTLGYWANSYAEELPNPNKSATFLIRIEDVTSRVLDALTEPLTEEERGKRIREVSDRIDSEATRNTYYDASVESFFNGNQYYLLVTETFKDVRLVGAPPSSIGKFGADTDNWMWPRQTGDFSIFRVYCAPDGSPAEYSEKNVPYRPRKFLPISLKGVHEGDFTMVLGYPGKTDRYLTSYGVRELMTETNPNRIRIRGVKQDIWLHDMMGNDKIRIQYSSKYSESTNYWKFSIGQQQAFNRQGIIGEREKEEKEFAEWAAADTLRKSRYGNCLQELNDAYTSRKTCEHVYQYLTEGFMNSVEILQPAVELFNNASFDNSGKLTLKTDMIRKNFETFYRDYNLPTDKKVTEAILQLYHDNVPREFLLDDFDLMMRKFRGHYDRFANFLYKRSIFSDKDKAMSFLEKPSVWKIRRDPAVQLFATIQSLYVSAIQETINKSDEKIDKYSRLYLQGLMEMHSEHHFYPDANSTMRMTYGKVGGYKPRDAVNYLYYTTLEGVMEKEDSTNWEFVVGRRLKELFLKKDYGRYGQNGVMPVCFITDNDITGGNSGSPVINANGELVGLAFDGNWEGLSGDVSFDDSLQRCICVDIRYVLFVMDKVAGAKRLINELTIDE